MKSEVFFSSTDSPVWIYMLRFSDMAPFYMWPHLDLAQSCIKCGQVMKTTRPTNSSFYSSNILQMYLERGKRRRKKEMFYFLIFFY